MEAPFPKFACVSGDGANDLDPPRVLSTILLLVLFNFHSRDLWLFAGVLANSKFLSIEAIDKAKLLILLPHLSILDSLLVGV